MNHPPPQPPPPPPPTAPFPDHSTFTFLSPPPQNINPNPPTFFHPPYHHHHHHQHFPPPPSPISTPTPIPVTPPPPDLTSTLSTLNNLIQLADTTITSLSSLLPTTTAPTSSLTTCPFNPNHRLPPSSLFRHTLTCPSSPAPIPLSLLDSLHYPSTLQSSETLAKQNRIIQSDAVSPELCFSLDDYVDPTSNFFYRDCPGVVSSADQDAASNNRLFTLPRVLSAECADIVSDAREIRASPLDCARLLPSEVWLVRSETEAWNDYPTSYSYSILRSILWLHLSGDGGFCYTPTWLIVNSTRYGVVIDVPMRDHVFVLVTLCLKAILREAIGVANNLFDREAKELSAKDLRFQCPNMAQVLLWLGNQLSVLYGEVNGKSFAVEMLKQCLVSASLNAAKELVGEAEEQLERVISDSSLDGEVFVSQVAAAVAALHERALLEEKIRFIRHSQPLANIQRVAEHTYVSKRAYEERQKRPNYRPIIEHDGLLWQRGRNQETNKMKSKEELLAEERDYKRRRMSYRGKKMKRTTTQVMRDIIEDYMEDIKQAGGYGSSATTAKVAGSFASESFPAHEYSTDNDRNVNRGQSQDQRNALSSHSNLSSTRVEDESPGDSKHRRRDSHSKQLDSERDSHSKRHDSEYYSRSRDRRGRDSHSKQCDSEYYLRSPEGRRRDDSEYYVRSPEGSRRDSHRHHEPIEDQISVNKRHGREYLSRTSDERRSNGRLGDKNSKRGSHERTSHRRDQVDQNVEDKSKRSSSVHRDNRSVSVTNNKFEDRYDPSESCDFYKDV